MAENKPKTFKIIFSITGIAFTALVMFALFGPESCGPSQEDKTLLSTLNNLDELAQKGGYVKTVTTERGKDSEGNFYRFQAEIVDEKGVGLGKLRGRRVEGFGTMKPRILWYKTPGVPEDFPPYQGRGGGGRGGGGRGGRGQQGGQAADQAGQGGQKGQAAKGQ